MPGRVFEPMRYWRLPSMEDEMSRWLEGTPSEQQYQRMEWDVEAARRKWAPTAKAWVLFEDLVEEVYNRQVVIPLYATLMDEMGVEEGPTPLKARCSDIVARPDENGKIHVFLKIERMEYLTEDGYIGEGRKEYFTPGDSPESYWVNLGDVYSLKVVE